VPNAFGEGLTLRPTPIPTPVDGGPKRDVPVAGVVEGPNKVAEVVVPKGGVAVDAPKGGVAVDVPKGGVAVDCEPKSDVLVGGAPNIEPVVGGVDVVGVPNNEPLLLVEPNIEPPVLVVGEGPKILGGVLIVPPPAVPKGELPKGDGVGAAPNKLVEGVGLAGIRLPEAGVSANGFGAVLAAKGLMVPALTDG